MSFFGSKSNKSSSSGNVGPAGRKTSGTYGTAKDAKQALKRNVFRNQYHYNMAQELLEIFILTKF